MGIYESPLEVENNGLVVPINTLQESTGHSYEVTGFAITAQQPIDDKGLDELRQRIAAVQPGLEVTQLRRSDKDETPKSQPDKNKLHSGDQKNMQGK